MRLNSFAADKDGSYEIVVVIKICYSAPMPVSSSSRSPSGLAIIGVKRECDEGGGDGGGGVVMQVRRVKMNVIR